MGDILLVVFLILVILILIVGILATNFVVKMTLMAKRKDSKLMVEELWHNFGTDYRNYQHLPKEKITIKSEDGLKLNGYYHNVYPESKKIVIINHGYTANHFVTYQFTDMFFEEKYNVLLIDMRSHGESEGKFASYGYNESKDMGLWIKWIKNNVGEDTCIGLHGQSMGAATVLLYGGKYSNEIKFIISDCGFTRVKDAIRFQFEQAKMPFWPLYDLARIKVKRKFKFDFNEISPREAIINSSVPVLFVHGKDDNIVPCWMSEKMYKSKNGSKDMIYLVDGANHMESYSKDKDKYKSKVKEFLNNIDR